MSETRELKRPPRSTGHHVGLPHGRASADSDQAPPVTPLHPFGARGTSVLPSGTADILALQRAVGNRAVQRLLTSRGHGSATPAPAMGPLQRKIALNSAQLAGQLSWRGKLNRSTAAQIVTTIEEYQRAKTPLHELQLLVAAVKLIDRWLTRAGANLSADQQQREATLRTMRADAKNEIDRLRITVMQTELGLPPAFAQSIPLADLHCIAKANSALIEGDVAGADAALQQMQSPPAQAAKGLIKQILLRKHIGVVNAKLAKVMNDPTAKYRHKGHGKSLMQGSAKAEDVTQKNAPEHIEHVTPGQKEFEDKKGHVPSNVTEGELQGIAAYTTNAYKAFNNPLRSDLGTQQFSRAQVDLTRLTVSGLNKMPPYTANGGQVYRHVGIFPGYLELNQEGGTYSDLAFMSTAATVKGTNKGAAGHDVLEVLDSHSGRDVQHLSAFGTGEAEVLFRPGTRFQIVKVVKVVNGVTVPPHPMLQSCLDQDGKKSTLQYVIYKKEV